MALQYLTAFAVATNVKAGTKTSSFSFTPIKIHEMCKADVPELVVITYLAPVNFIPILADVFFKRSSKDL